VKRIIPLVDITARCLPQRMSEKIISAISVLACNTFYNKQYRYTSSLVNSVFNEMTVKESKYIARTSFKTFCMFFSEYQIFARRSPEVISSLAENVKLQGEDNLQLAISSGQPAIVVSIHMGEFYSGFLKLCFLSPKTRPVTIIKMPQQSKKEDAAYRNFRSTGLNINVLRLENKPGIEAFKKLREGHILFMLCDLSSSHFKKTAQVKFLGDSARFAIGPAELALTTEAIILPVVVFRDEDGANILRIEQPIDTRLYKKEGNLTEAATRVTQAMVNFFDGWIRKHPGQWHFWPYLGSIWKTD